MKRTQLKQKTSLKSKTGLQRGFLTKAKTFMKRKAIRKKPVEDSKMAILDKIFSEYIRRINSNDSGITTCFTCGKTGHYETMQLGHYRPRAHMATRYHELNCKVQCEDCNCYKDGMYKTFGLRLDALHGPNTAESMYELSQTIVHDFPFDEKIAEYSEKLIALIKHQEDVIQY